MARAWTWTAGSSTRSRSPSRRHAAARGHARRARRRRTTRRRRRRSTPLRTACRADDSAARCSIFSDGSATPCDVRRDYELGAEIGAGHFGRVFACDRRADGRKFACKQLAARLVRDALAVRREVAIMRRLAHRHVQESRRSTSTGTTRGSCRALRGRRPAPVPGARGRVAARAARRIRS